MKSKFKIGLSALVPIATIGTVAPLVTACSKSQVIKHVHESKIDTKYGLNARTYKLLKKDYESKLTRSMTAQGIQKDSTLWNSKMSKLQTAFNTFDNKAKNISMSYATLTSSLMKYAMSTDKLQLRRVTNARWSDVNALFQGAYDSFDLFMTHEHFSEDKKTQILNEAASQFNAKLIQLESEGYKENDPFGAVQEIRMNLINFFDGVNDKICYLSSQMRLADFNSKYTIRYKTLADSSSYKSVWTEVSNNVGKIISENLFNKLFNLVDESTGNIVLFQPALLIPGYTLRPKLVSCSADEKSNIFKIELDLGLIKTSYLKSSDEATINKMTVHDVKLDRDLGIVDKTGKINEAIEQNKDLSNDEDFFNFTSNLPIKTESYNLWNQLSYENNTIKNTYFNKSKPEYIRFKWLDASSKDASIDPFINQISIDSENKSCFIGLEGLAQAGLQMSQDGKNWYSLANVTLSLVNKKALNAANFAREDLQLKFSLLEEFVENCNLISEATYVENGSSYEITNTFFVTFRESSSLKTLEDAYTVDKEFVKGKCENYKISQSEFIRASTNYSNADRVVNGFNKGWDAIDNIDFGIFWWQASLVTLELVIAGCMIALGIRCYHKPNANDIAALITGAVGTAAAVHGLIILGKMEHATNDYLNRASEVKRNPTVINLCNKLNQFSHTFTEIDRQGNYDKKDAEAKNNKFQGMALKTQWEAVSYLTSIFDKGHDGYAFKQLIDDKNVGVQAVQEIKDMFSTNNVEFQTLIGHTVAVVGAAIECGQALAHKEDTNKDKKTNDKNAELEGQNNSPEVEQLKGDQVKRNEAAKDYFDKNGDATEKAFSKGRKPDDLVNEIDKKYQNKLKKVSNAAEESDVKDLRMILDPEEYDRLEIRKASKKLDELKDYTHANSRATYPLNGSKKEKCNWWNNMQKFTKNNGVHDKILEMDAIKERMGKVMYETSGLAPGPKAVSLGNQLYSLQNQWNSLAWDLTKWYPDFFNRARDYDSMKILLNFKILVK